METLRLGEEMLEGFADQGRIAVKLSTNGEDGNLAVCEIEVVFEERSWHHAGNCDELVWDLLESEDMADFDREGRTLVAEEDYGWRGHFAGVATVNENGVLLLEYLQECCG